MGTNSMPTVQPRYGRPKGSGLDDSWQLERIAALIADNPSLKLSTAIRALGVDDPSVIRRLRDKFHMDQARLMAIARHLPRSNGRWISVPRALQATQSPELQKVPNISPIAHARAPEASFAVETAPTSEQPSPLAVWCDLGLWALTTSIEQHAVLARHWLHHPAVEIALRGQLAVGAFLVAASTPRKPLKPRIH